MLTYHFIIKGRVQGVGYRATLTLKAMTLGVKGSIRNLDDGDVEVYVQGNDTEISTFKKYLKIGSMFSRTDEIIEKTLDLPEFKEFETIY
nr:acylphosphatase [uncultured Cetobacterium sp.]